MSAEPPSTGTSRPATPPARAQSDATVPRRDETEPFVEPVIDLGDLSELEELGALAELADRADRGNRVRGDRLDRGGIRPARVKPPAMSAAAIRAATIPGPAAPPPRTTAMSTPVAGTSAAIASTSTNPSASTGRTSASACPVCGGPVDVRSPHVAVAGGAVRVYCTRACLDARDALPADANTVSLALPPKSRRLRWLLAAFVLLAGGGAAAFALLRANPEPPTPPPPLAIAATPMPPKPEPTLDTIADPNREADAKLVADLMRDAWIHPLAGPVRRMPRNHTGAFGAARAGDRPPECVSGHCGVDIGRVWGEPVHAVHDGVVEFINRGPNEERGGVFVRISHRGGTLFSWYFHLAAVPRSLHRGDKVKAGQVIGVLGDTGIKHSAPHLHFALSVKPTKTARERYLDPESLIAIWPLWIPDESGTGGRIATKIDPGMPVRADHHKRGKRAKKRGPRSSAHAVASPDKSATDTAETEAPTSTETSSAKTTPPPAVKAAAPSPAKTTAPPPANSAQPAPAEVPASPNAADRRHGRNTN